MVVASTCRVCGAVTGDADGSHQCTGFDSAALADRIAAWSGSPEGKASLEEVKKRIEEINKPPSQEDIEAFQELIRKPTTI